MGIKIRRIVAWIIDWILSGIPAFVCAFIISAYVMESGGTITPPLVLLFFLCVFSYPVLFILRDVIFCGRSIGKRILGLRVIDRETGQIPAIWKRIVRSAFLFVYLADGVYLLATGKSLGDTVCETTVVRA